MESSRRKKAGKEKKWEKGLQMESRLSAPRQTRLAFDHIPLITHPTMQLGTAQGGSINPNPQHKKRHNTITEQHTALGYKLQRPHYKPQNASASAQGGPAKQNPQHSHCIAFGSGGWGPSIYLQLHVPQCIWV